MARDDDRSASARPANGGDSGGEMAFLAWVKQKQAGLAQAGGAVREAAGNDLAVLDWQAGGGGLLLLGVDPVLDGVHVDIAAHGPRAAGRKAMNRNLSDVAAMGGEPVAALLSLVAPRSARLEMLQEVYLGAEEAGATFNCPIVGGDFASWEGPLVVTVSILGRAARPVGRGNVKPGQRLYVTGPLGGSILGRHLHFTPRLDLSREIVRQCNPSAMLDVSDGVSRDLPRLLGEGRGARVRGESVPVHADARQLAQSSGRDPLWHALNDGEDYELLFAAEACGVPGCVEIGVVTAEPGVWLEREGHVEPLAPQGWEHRLEG